MIVYLEFLPMYRDFDYLMLVHDFLREKIFHSNRTLEVAYRMELIFFLRVNC